MAAKLKIYTRTGDKGETSLFGGTRVSKGSDRVETYGSVDELNSMLGVVVAHLKASERRLEKELEHIQNDLLDIGSALATPKKKSIPGLENRPLDFEKLIDQMTGKLPELRNFILPGGSRAGSFLHIARTICRRVERQLVRLVQKEEIDEAIVKYFNRLSDLLFTMARFVNHKEKKKETLWSK